MMKTNSNNITPPSHFRVAIVGGGIVGAGIFRDLSLHGVDTVLLERSQFSSETSSKSSKLLHGGIRYLENFDFPLVYEALHEKNLWIQNSPKLAYEEAFILPVYKNDKRPLPLIALGMFLYDLLSGFKNSPFKILNKKSLLKLLPDLNPEKLVGAGLYYDGVMNDHQMTIEVINSALKENPTCRAYENSEVSLVNFDENKKIYFIQTATGIMYSADFVIYALGPFTDIFLKKYQNYFHWDNVMNLSKGSHLYLKSDRIKLPHAMVITEGNRIIFVVPRKDAILVGTTEIAYTATTAEHITALTVSLEEKNYLIDAINKLFPNAHINLSDIQGEFIGVRPLVKELETNKNTGVAKTSRHHAIWRPHSHSYVIAGGKYTTFRVMGQEITREILHRLNRPYLPDLSLKPIRNS